MLRIINLIILLAMMTFGSSSVQSQKHEYTNELIHESSPYLLQHAHNPVNWYPWGEKALELARRDNKMLIISIGYSACHWCHVMEHESFEDTAVAAIMNDHFISIKVDREERPDVDQVYMDAVQIISGQGGWPLNAFALPDGKPFYAGTYFRKEDWLQVLQYFIDVYEDDPGKLTQQAENITNGIQTNEQIPAESQTAAYSMDHLDRTFSNLQPHLDMKKGGLNRAPKFPMPVAWKYLMNYHYLGGDPKALEAVISTLDNVAMGGIYDHVGGGFSRYSTDLDWHVPHFEKMLYDNAQLMEFYARGWQITADPVYKDVVYETHEFIQRELGSDEGGFYAALDADSEGEEGKYYVWTHAEIKEIIGEKAILFSDYYNITEQGNWEDGKNILFRKKTDAEFAEKHGLTEEDLKETINHGKKLLLKERSRRIAPGLDDKILTSWNALMARAYAYCYQAFDDQEFLDIALKSARFIENNAMEEDLQMTRNYKNGKSSIPAFLDDYAFTISAFIELYLSTFDEQWLIKAESLMDYTLEHFLDTQTGMFFYTHDQHSDLIVRKKEVPDNVIPSSNSQMANNLFQLGTYLYRDDLLNVSRRMLGLVREDIHQNPFYYSNWAILEANLVKPPFEVVIIGDDYESIRKEFARKYLPDVVLSGGKREGNLELHKGKYAEGETMIFICRDRVCKLPVREFSEALKQIED
jgi:uncharacterized protein YyaL (SSP411 family)